MQILVIGDHLILNEFKEKFTSKHNYRFVEESNFDEDMLQEIEVVFDFTLDEEPENIERYLDVEELFVFGNVVKSSLSEISYIHQNIACTLVGFNGLPTFVNRSVLEVSILPDTNQGEVERILQALETDFVFVEDRVGMVTPRVVCMIINEAFFTVQEGTATREDIDLGMKLGTNYPFGPFEWCNKIGIQHVYELIEAIYEDTKDERYKICPLLKREYLLG